MSRQVPVGPDHDALLLAALFKSGVKTEETRLTTADGVTGRYDQSQNVPTDTTTNGKPDHIPLDNFVEATPHLNSDGTITVTCKTQRAVLVPDVTPLAATTSTLSTTRTFHDDQTVLVGGVVDPIDAGPTTHLVFVKVTTAVF